MAALLIALIAAGFGLAMVLGDVASRLRMPPLVGYLLASVAIGPAHPALWLTCAGGTAGGNRGDAADVRCGTAFFAGDLLAVRKIAVPAVVQIAVATVAGTGNAVWWGFNPGEASGRFRLKAPVGANTVTCYCGAPGVKGHSSSTQQQAMRSGAGWWSGDTYHGPGTGAPAGAGPLLPGVAPATADLQGAGLAIG